MKSIRGSKLSAYLQLHFVILIWGFTAILGKLITVPTVELVFYRTFIAVIGLFIIVKLAKLQFLDFKTAFPIIGTGVIIALHWITFFLAARVSNVSICLAGIATTSLWTSFIEPIIYKRKIHWYEPVLGAVSAIGIAIVFNSAFDQWLGLLIAMLSAVLAATFTVINSKFIAKYNHYIISMYEMAGACLMTIVCLLLFFNIGMIKSINLSVNLMDMLYLLVLGGLCTVFAYSIGVKVMKKITPFSVNLSINLEPVYGILLAVLIFGEEEKMEFNFYLGTLLILVSIAAYPIIKYRLNRNIKR